ncbi:MAG: hypothetical protein ACYCWW_09380 [Deltaproteobacteria bacterium]
MLLLALLAGCPKKSPSGSDGGGVPNICNSASEATSSAACQLTLGTAESFYLDHAGKQLWLSVTLPQSLPKNPLLQIQAGYSAEIGTSVQLAINVLQSNQKTSLARAADDHGAGAPQPVEILIPAPAAGSQLFLLATDDTGQSFDDRTPFSITANVIQDPDPNPTGQPIPLTLSAGANGVETAQGSGVLSTPNRVDEFQVTIPQMTRPILYASLTAPNQSLAPPVAYLMAYVIDDGQGGIVAEAHMPNRFLPIDLATARLVQPGHSYNVKVFGWGTPGDPTPVPGDTRLTYTLSVSVMPDLDQNEPNDTEGQATPVVFSSGDLDASPKTLTGRLAYVPDEDWFDVQLPASGSPTRLHYKLTPGSGPGRFPPLPGLPLRQALALNPVTVPSGADPVLSCETDETVCPNDSTNLPSIQGLIDAYCETDGGPLCLTSYRGEDSNFQALSNFEGVLPVPPSSGTTHVYLLYQDQGQAWADDVPYTLSVEWESETPDKQGGYYDSFATAKRATLAVDNGGASWPSPPSNATTLSGSVSVGNGFFVNLDPVNGPYGVHAQPDYDAFPSSLDVYELDFPAYDGGMDALGRSFELAWSLQDTGPNGTRPYDLGLALEFCDGSDGGAGSCVLVPGTQSADPYANLSLLGYTSGPVTSWYTGQNHVDVWSLTDDGTTANISAGAQGCFCFEQRFLQGGKFYLEVVGVDRTSYVDSQYQIRMALAPYPEAYTPDGGTPTSCPVDAGFTDGNGNPVAGCAMEPAAP